VAGKYAHLIDKLPRLMDNEPAYQEKVEAVKKAMLEEAGVNFFPAHQLVKGYEALRGTKESKELCPENVIEAIIRQFGKEGLEEIVKEVNLRLEAVTQMMVDQFEVEDTTSLTVEGVGNVRTQYEPYAKVEDKDKFRLWCINHCQTCGKPKDQHPVIDQVEGESVMVCRNAATLENSLQLWPSTMNAITKERLLAGLPEPDGVTAFAKVKVVLTRGK